MKFSFFIITILLINTSCKKELSETQPKNKAIQLYLKKRLPVAIYDSLKLSYLVISEDSSSNHTIYNYPISTNKFRSSFVLVNVNRFTKDTVGRIIEICAFGSGMINANKELIVKDLYNRLIKRTAGNGKQKSSKIPGNEIMSLVQATTTNSAYPDLIDISTFLNRMNNPQTWIRTQSLFLMNGAAGNTYTPVTPYSGSPNYSSTVPFINIDFETDYSNKEINIEQYLKCFDLIPNAGATYSIELLTDIPIDNNPDKFINFQTNSPGHTFLQLKKSNGDKSVVQNIGFYPKYGWKTMLTPAPVTGMFVDNGKHEFNASLTRTVKAEDFNKAITHIRYLAKFIKYDIDEYNCTDFAIEVFNQAMSIDNKITIPRYQIPGGMAPAGTSTPQGTYNKLFSILETLGSATSKIEIPGYKGWVTGSKGPCM